MISPRVFWVRTKGNSYSVVRHRRGYFYIQRRRNSSVNSDTHRKLKNDLRITRNNNSIYRKMVSGMSQWSIVQSVSRDSQPYDNFWPNSKSWNRQIRHKWKSSKNYELKIPNWKMEIQIWNIECLKWKAIFQNWPVRFNKQMWVISIDDLFHSVNK